MHTATFKTVMLISFIVFNFYDDWSLYMCYYYCCITIGRTPVELLRRLISVSSYVHLLSFIIKTKGMVLPAVMKRGLNVSEMRSNIMSTSLSLSLPHWCAIVLFKIYDKDKDGKLSKDDLAHVRIHLYVHILWFLCSHAFKSL